MPQDGERIGRWIAEPLNRVLGQVRFLISEGGVSALDAPGQLFWWPQADAAQFEAIERHTEQGPRRRVLRVRAHINDEGFISAVVAAVHEATVQTGASG